MLVMLFYSQFASPFAASYGVRICIARRGTMDALNQRSIAVDRFARSK